jgi:hypothetical protein
VINFLTIIVNKECLTVLFKVDFKEMSDLLFVDRFNGLFGTLVISEHDFRSEEVVAFLKLDFTLLVVGILYIYKEVKNKIKKIKKIKKKREKRKKENVITG